MERGEVVEAGGDLALEALEASIEAELAGLGELVLFSGGLEGWESNGEGAEGLLRFAAGFFFLFTTSNLVSLGVLLAKGNSSDRLFGLSPAPILNSQCIRFVKLLMGSKVSIF